MTASLSEQHLNLSPEKSWQASLSLKFSRRVQKNALVSALHKGPLRVQRAFYPEGPIVPHIYLLHPPGGVVAGDELAINIDVEKDSHGLVTTPSAGRVYRTNDQGLLQQQVVTGRVESGGVLEWLPQENIVFNRANGTNLNRFYLKGGAKLMTWDICCLGRIAGDEPFVAGNFVQGLEIYQNDKLALAERMAIDGGSDMLNAAWGMQGFSVMGTFVATLEDKDVLKCLKDELQLINQNYRLAFTQKKSFLIVRYLGHSGIEARTLFSQAWQLIRPALIDRVACEPRIWHT